MRGGGTASPAGPSCTKWTGNRLECLLWHAATMPFMCYVLFVEENAFDASHCPESFTFLAPEALAVDHWESHISLD